jgi:hypothetical protein
VSAAHPGATMKGDHIIEMLEKERLSSLGDDQVLQITAHTSDCSECQRAYDATVISSLMLKARASQDVAPSPFFKTRVMSAIRDRESRDIVTFGRLWKNARVAVSSMVALVLVLITLTFLGQQGSLVGPAPQDLSPKVYGLEQVVFDEGELPVDENLTNGQIIDAVFDSGDIYGN